jgi:hypothetical protein
MIAIPEPRVNGANAMCPIQATAYQDLPCAAKWTGVASSSNWEKDSVIMRNSLQIDAHAPLGCATRLRYAPTRLPPGRPAAMLAGVPQVSKRRLFPVAC